MGIQDTLLAIDPVDGTVHVNLCTETVTNQTSVTPHTPELLRLLHYLESVVSSQPFFNIPI